MLRMEPEMERVLMQLGGNNQVAAAAAAAAVIVVIPPGCFLVAR